ncbi:MAG: helix-hairpin-helix domain-containing protein [Candidatus Promineifilaceae bacterium]
MNNRQIADLFIQMADLMSIRGDNFHRTLAYRKGAETIMGLDRGIEEMVAAGEKLTALPAIGKTLAAKINELVTTGELTAFNKLAKEMPSDLVNLLRVEGLGPKRVGQIYKALGVVTLEQLKEAAAEGKLETLPKMGKKSAEKILHNVTALLNRGDERTPIGIAYPLAHTILNELKTLDGVLKAEIGGSLRRSRETIGDIDLLVGIADDTDPMPIMDHFVNRYNVETIEGHGNTKSSVILDTGMKVDLRVLPIKYWGTLMSYFTGSQAHNVKLRELARKQGLSLNEYSFTPDDGGDDIVCATEEDVYTTLNLPYIAPQLRENRGEVEAAQQGNLPTLVQQSDIVSDLHMHSTWSDGKFSILEMAQEAIRRSLQYIAITDHSYSLGIANGLTPERL